MRPIKFRAWNEKDSNPNARMIHPATLTHDGKVMMPNGEEWEIPVMQFTGLLDKNGKEIYEGDITRRVNTEGTIEITEVKYKAPYWTVKDFNPDYGYTVIGNIYENPELITS